MKEHHDSDGDDDNSVGGSQSLPDGRAEQERRRLAEVESKQICFWKTAVVGALIVAGNAVSLSINMYLKNQQEKEIDQNVSTSHYWHLHGCPGVGTVHPHQYSSDAFVSSTSLPKL